MGHGEPVRPETAPQLAAPRALRPIRKLIIQIPCYNEEASLPVTLAALPRALPGVERVEWLVIDDGSTDATAEVARRCGVDHVLRLPHQGLARAFTAGVEACLRAGADLIVNTDADNQYCAEDLPALILPILEGRAEIVIGARPVEKTEHFSRSKKLLQRIGSWVVRLASGTDIPDAPSGFRAISREAALRLNIFSGYTYTLEMIIQAGQKRLPITWVPVRTNGVLRPSRLFRSTPVYVWRSVGTIFRIFMAYRPLRFFFALGCIPFTLGFLLGVRWVLLYLLGTPRSHVPSLIAAAILMLFGTQLWIMGLIADLMAVNRTLLEEIQLRLRKAEFDGAPLAVGLRSDGRGGG